MQKNAFAMLEGLRVLYESRGTGSHGLVFVHGWASGRWQWRMQMGALSLNRQLLALDLPGHGESDKPQIAYTMSFFARAVGAVLDSAGIDRAVLVGHSNGVPVIRQFYRLYPERTEALVAVDGPLRQTMPPERIQWMRAALKRADYASFVAQLAEQTPRGQLPQEDWERLKAGQVKTPQHVMQAGLDAISDPSIWAEDPINVPLLVMIAQGPTNPAGDRGAADYKAFLHRLAARVEVQVWENASHFFPLEQPERFNRVLQTWLSSLGE